MLIFITAMFLAQPLSEQEVFFETLSPSGIRIILCNRVEGNTFSIAAGFRVGSAFDNAATCGYAHIIEHQLLFRSSEISDENTILLHWRDLGGDINGRTFPDYTLFTAQFDEESLYQALELLRGMLMHPLFSPVELDRERKVLCSELKSRESEPFFEIYSMAIQALYGEHNYGLPIEGYSRIINQVSSNDLFTRFQTEYSPGRLTLAIVGPIRDRQKLRDFLAETFGTYSIGKNTPPEVPDIVPVKGGIRKIVKTKRKSAHICFAFLGPPSNDKDWLPFVVVANALCSGERSILQKRLIFQDGIATRVDLTIEPRVKGGLALFRIQLDEQNPENLQRCEREVKKVLAEVGERLPDLEIINRARNQIALEYGLKTESYKALAAQLIRWDMLGRWNFSLDISNSLATLPNETFKRIGTTYFSGDNCTIVAMVPETWPASSYERGENRLLRERIKITSESPFPLVSICLPNTKMFSFAITVKGGIVKDRLGEEGFGGLVARAIMRGGIGEKGEDFQDRLLRYGVKTEAGTMRDYTYIRFSAPEGYFEDALERISRAIVEPAFNPVELEDVRRNILSETEGFPSIMEVAERMLWKHAFTGEQYGVFPPGKKEYFKKEIWNLPYKSRDYWERWWRPGNFTVAVCGPMQADQLAKIVLKTFEPMSRVDRNVLSPGKVTIKPQSDPQIILSDWNNGKSESGQTFLLHAWFASESTVENLTVFLLIKEILAGAPGTRLWKLRQDEGLLYDFSAKVVVSKEVLCFELFMVLPVNRINRARLELFSEMNRLATSFVSETELDLARKAIIRAKHERSISGATLVNEEAWYLFANWTSEEFMQSLNRITPAILRNKASKFFRKSRAWTVGIGPESILKDKLGS